MVKEQVSHSLVRALRNVPIFAALEDHDLIHLVGISANLHWDAGSTVFNAGSPSDALYIVLSGEVRIFSSEDKQERDIARIGRGDFFGEMSVLLDRKHSRSAEALEDSELMVIPTELFRRLLDGDSGLAQHVRSRMEERLRANDEALSRT